MCGIAGWFAPGQQVSPVVLEAMNATQVCRGPDAGGVWFAPGIGLAHRRLAVVDLVGGVQPMRRQLPPSTDELVLSYSGEVYNFRQLRQELESLGQRFTTSSDTEVVLAAYAAWGESAFARFIGIFAFALWDGARGRLLLVRDRLGVKPLHFARRGREVIFGSEPKAVLTHPDVSARMDGEGLVATFAMFGLHRPGRTPLQGVEEVPAGCYAVVDDKGLSITRYWQLSVVDHRDSPQQTVRHTRELLDEAVSSQLISDVPLCSLLSGGVDSSAVSALALRARRARGGGLTTYTVNPNLEAQHFTPDADRPDLDAPWVDRVVRHLGTDHVDVTLPVTDVLGMQERATRAKDAPALGDLDSSLLSLFGRVSDRFTVALSGESADEVFGGYAWFQDRERVRRAGFPWMLDDLGLANLLRPDLIERLDPVGQVQAEYAAAVAAVPRMPGESQPDERMRVISHLALTHFLPVLLDRKDRMSMAVGVEVRVPFCDHRLVEYVWNVPWSLRERVGRRPSNGKPLLREAVRGLLPGDVIDRPKAMFPAVNDPAYDAAVHRRVEGVLKASRLRDLLDADKVLDLQSGRSRRPAWMQRLALGYLIQVERWLELLDVEIDV